LFGVGPALFLFGLASLFYPPLRHWLRVSLESAGLPVGADLCGGVAELISSQ